MKVFINTIDRGQEEYAQLHVGEATADIKRLAEYIEKNRYLAVSIVCHWEGEVFSVVSNDICYIESEEGTQVIHTKDVRYETKMRLYELLGQLPFIFMRVSKSVIINIEQVRSYRPMFSGMMQVSFDGGKTAYISRKYLKEVRGRIMEVWYERENKEKKRMGLDGTRV